MSRPTAAQYIEAIRHVLEAKDVKAASGLITLMTLEHPREAEDLRQTILLGIELAKRADS